jgi:hypothetical protein
MVQALDWLRVKLAAAPELQHLAHLLPPPKPPGKHPIWLYERNMRAARKAAQA